MPFDFDDYQKKCNEMTTEQLNKEWDIYTRQIAAGSTSTATSVLLSAFTGGVSLIGLGFSAPRIHNARKKREIIQAGLETRGTTHHTHAKDVLVPMATVGAAGGITLGLGISGAELIPTTGGMGHLAVDYVASHAATSVAMTYSKYKARELAQTNEDGTPEPGIQSSQTWPQDPPEKERFGPQLGPIRHPYSIFGHIDEPLEDSVAPSSVPAYPPQPDISSLQTTPTGLSSLLTTPSSSSSPANEYSVPANSNDQNQNLRSLSLPASNSMHRLPRKQIARTQSDYPGTRQSSQNSVEKPVLDPIVGQETDSTPHATISDDHLDDLVAVLADEEQMMLLMKLELEVRIPGGNQPLHRTNAVYTSHSRRPHFNHDDKRTSLQISERESADASLTSSNRLPIQLSDGPCDLDEPAQTLPPRHPSPPVRPAPAVQQPTMPPRSPSLPVRLDSPYAPTILSPNVEIESSQILRRPLVTSPRQSYSAQSTLPQPQRPRPKDQRQDSGYCSATSTPLVQSDVPPPYTPRETR